MFIETPAHTAIFNVIREKKRNLIIYAVAGAGKSTTLVQGLNCTDPRESILFLAFNKRIAEALQPRVPAHVTCMTLNALGHRAVMAAQRGVNVKLDTNKVWDLSKRLMDVQDFQILGGTVVKVVRLAKAAGIIPAGIPGCRDGVVPDTDATWLGLIDHHDVEVPGDNQTAARQQVVSYARAVLRENIKITTTIDFDDQLLLPFAYRYPCPRHDRVMVDEAQDLSPLQHELVASALREGGQLIACGDANQSLYGFRGADANSMANMERRFNMVSLPLHVSYRCPQNVVRLAQKWVPHIQAHPSAPMGVVADGRPDFRSVEFQPGEMVLCRTNAPLVQVAYHLLRKRIPCCILGREIGAGLVSLIKKQKVQGVKELLENISVWEEKEASRFQSRGQDDKAAQVHDTAETIRIFCEGVDFVSEVEAAVTRMFDDAAKAGQVVLGTIHKLKGQESENVTILNFDDMPSRWAKQDWQKQQEVNCLYVAVTRSQRNLRMVVVPSNRPKRG